MRILLVVPPRPGLQVLNLIPPYALGYLAAACRRAGHEPAILDCPLEGMDAAALARRVLRDSPAVVGFTLFTSDVRAVERACRELKALPRPPVVVLGGVHPSSVPVETMEAVPAADYLVQGEAEQALPALLDLLAESPEPGAERLRGIPGLAWREGGRAVPNPRGPHPDLAALGMPAWDLIDPLRYQRYPPVLFVRQTPFAPLITTRGCPFGCTFCGGHNVTGHRVRNRPLPLVFEELDLLRKRYGIREVHIEDDNFTWERGRVVEFCEELIRRDWRLSWTMPNGVRIDTLDLELLRLMKRAGCYLLIVGVESGSDRILRHMKKNLTVRTVVEKMELVRQAGILAHAFFMLGYPEETVEDFEATLELALRLPIIGAHFASYRPLPGTEAAAGLLARGEIEGFSCGAEAGTFASVVYAPRGMTPALVKIWQRRMLWRFYLRPAILGTYLRELGRDPRALVNLARRARLYLLTNR